MASKSIVNQQFKALSQSLAHSLALTREVETDELKFNQIAYLNSN